MLLTQTQFNDICQYARTARLAQMLPFFNESLGLAEITTPLRAAMYIGQLAHESGEFRYMEELDSGWLYDKDINPKLAAKLGNTVKGDGPRYKGRGPMQCTGRKNYTRVTAALCTDYVNDPESVAKPEHGFKVTAWLWTHSLDRYDVEHNLNKFADASDVEGCTQVINGGLHGLDKRLAYYCRALKVLGVVL